MISQTNKVAFALVLVLFLVAGAGYFIYTHPRVPAGPINSFEECARVVKIVTQTSPRECRTPDNRVFIEQIPEITYNNASADLIAVDLPYPTAVVGKDFSVIGRARGTWYFEASFPIEVLDKNGNSLAKGVAQAQSDWMTTDLVPFKADIKIPETYIGPATLVLKKDNPSGLSEKDASISFPITIEY